MLCLKGVVMGSAAWALFAFLSPLVFVFFFYMTTFLLSLFWALDSAPII
jgi:hypothetical protein